MPNAYSCEKAVGSAKTCDFRSGRVILKRTIEREQMVKLLADGKTDLLEKFISKKGRPFSAYLVRQPDGKTSFEFEQREPKAGGKGTRAAAASGSAGALRILGKHPADDQVISVYSGRYGPYVKHGTTNATLSDKDQADSITLDQAIALIEEKSGGVVSKKVAKKAPKKTAKSATKSAVNKTTKDAIVKTTTIKGAAKTKVVKASKTSTAKKQ